MGGERVDEPAKTLGPAKTVELGETVAMAENRKATAAPGAESSSETRGEIIKFGIVALLLLGAVLVIALTRPFVFNQIVPAILGGTGQALPPVSDELPTSPVTADEEETRPIVVDEEPATTDAYPAPDHDSFIPAVGGPDAQPGEGYPAPLAPDDVIDTAVLTHVVQRSENLTRIAGQYGVSVEAIVEQNNITNPDRINAGTILQIPADGDE